MKRKIFFIVVLLASFLTSSSVFASSVNITQLNFTSSPQSVNVNTVSSNITVQTQNSTKGSEQTDETNYLDLSSTSSTGEFSSSNSTWKPVNKLTMSIHSANRNFYYIDSTPGIYTLTVSAEGQNWISATQSITIVDNSIPADTTSPIISLIGDSTVNLSVGDTYIETVTATDDVDGDITSKIIPTGTVDTTKAGTYTIAYDVSDIAGNKATTITRTIQVNAVSSGGNGGGDGGNPEVTKNIHLKIETNDNSIYDKDISVVPCDDKGIEPITAYCALDQLEKSGILPIKSDWSGLWINSINGIVNNENNNEIYWMWLVNSNTTPNPAGFSCSQDYPYSCSAKEYFLKNNDQILFYYKPFLDPTDDSKPEVITPASGGGGSSHILNNKFDVDKALAYLANKQNSDGSFSSDLYTDWAGIALAGSNSSAKDKIINYLKNNSINSNVVTDNERHAMALMALGINPYTGTEINYIKKITDSFDGTQFGDASLVNDDIFAIFPLIKAGYSASDVMIQSDSSFIISKQGSDGSWGSVDLTAAAIQALSLTSSSGATTAIAKAEQYLKNAQQTDGGFSNISSTSWALQAIAALGEDSSTWTKNNFNPNDYLYTLQQTDGGMDSLITDEDTRIWATSYVISAVMNKSWGDIMQSFSKPATQNNSSGDVLENIDLPTPTNPVVCPKGDLFNTTTGQACTATNETNFIVINTPITNPNSSLVKKIENKKNIETPQEKNIKKPSSQIFGSPTSRTSAENNLGASVGDTVPIKISVKKILQVVSRLVISILTYIGKGFVDLIIFLQNQIIAVFK